MPLRERPSPNHNARGRRHRHADSALYRDGERGAALDRLCDPAAQVSAHYLIDEDGTVWRLVAENARAWHAGVSFWAGRRDINSASIGIELVNPGHDFGYRPFPRRRWRRSRSLARGILARHPIPPRHVLGHSDVAPAAQDRSGRALRLAAACARRRSAFWPDFAAAPGACRRRDASGRNPTRETSPKSAIDVPDARATADRTRATTAVPAPFPALLRYCDRRAPTRKTRDHAWRPSTALRRGSGPDLTLAPRRRPYHSGARRPDGRPRLQRRGRKVRAPRKHGAG